MKYLIVNALYLSADWNFWFVLRQSYVVQFTVGMWAH